jgi:hypothetical protein
MTKVASAVDRIKKTGGVLATFLGDMLILTYFHVKDNGLVKGLCKGLVTSPTNMAGAVVGQELGNNLYGKNSSPSEF